MRMIKVAAAQTGSVPASIIKSLVAQDINDKIINGDAKTKILSLKSLKDLDIDAIRTYNVGRMERRMEQAVGQNADLVVFPELALTSFFPYFWITDPN